MFDLQLDTSSVPVQNSVQAQVTVPLNRIPPADPTLGPSVVLRRAYGYGFGTGEMLILMSTNKSNPGYRVLETWLPDTLTSRVVTKTFEYKRAYYDPKLKDSTTYFAIMEVTLNSLMAPRFQVHNLDRAVRIPWQPLQVDILKFASAHFKAVFYTFVSLKLKLEQAKAESEKLLPRPKHKSPAPAPDPVTKPKPQGRGLVNVEVKGNRRVNLDDLELLFQ